MIGLKDEDALRDQFFEDADIKIIRINTGDLLKDIDKVVKKIKVAILCPPFGG